MMSGCQHWGFDTYDVKDGRIQRRSNYRHKNKDDDIGDDLYGSYRKGAGAAGRFSDASNKAVRFNENCERHNNKDDDIGDDLYGSYRKGAGAAGRFSDASNKAVRFNENCESFSRYKNKDDDVGDDLYGGYRKGAGPAGRYSDPSNSAARFNENCERYKNKDDDVDDDLYGGYRRGTGAAGRFSDVSNSAARFNENCERIPLRMRPPPVIVHDPDIDKVLRDTIPCGQNFDDYDKIPVSVKGWHPPRPIHTFDEANLRRQMLDIILRSGLKVPTPVQKYSLPILMEGHDLMACAQTGSGKTNAFVLPIVHRLLEDGCNFENTIGREVRPEAIVLSPTRELAKQIYHSFYKFCNNTPLRVHLLYGGTSVPFQQHSLNRGANIVISTPGRFLDFVTKNFVVLTQVKMFVLDEADQMLDHGFMPDIQRVIGHESMPPKKSRTTAMFSATFPDEIQTYAQKYLKPDYVFLAVGIVGGACKDIKQEFVKVQDNGEKLKYIKDYLRGMDDIATTRVLIFIEKKQYADMLAMELCNDAQGRVINYDLPESIDTYVHRIGRTGRVGNLGRSLSFYNPKTDYALARPLVERVLKDCDQHIPDWLKMEAMSYIPSNMPYGSSRYGARDIRTRPNRLRELNRRMLEARTGQSNSDDMEGWEGF